MACKLPGLLRGLVFAFSLLCKFTCTFIRPLKSVATSMAHRKCDLGLPKHWQSSLNWNFRQCLSRGPYCLAPSLYGPEGRETIPGFEIALETLRRWNVQIRKIETSFNDLNQVFPSELRRGGRQSSDANFPRQRPGLPQLRKFDLPRLSRSLL